MKYASTFFGMLLVAGVASGQTRVAPAMSAVNPVPASIQQELADLKRAQAAQAQQLAAQQQAIAKLTACTKQLKEKLKPVEAAPLGGGSQYYKPTNECD